MAENTRVDALIGRIKNHRWLSLVVSGGIVFLALVSFAKGLEEAGSILGKAFSSSNLGSQYDASTKEALLTVARDVDLFFLSVENDPDKTNYSAFAPTFIKIKGDLRSILLRNQVRPLNDIS